jgi:hypothetical protein
MNKRLPMTRRDFLKSSIATVTNFGTFGLTWATPCGACLRANWT